MLSMIAVEKFLPFVSFSERKKLFMKNKEDEFHSTYYLQFPAPSVSAEQSGTFAVSIS